MGRYSPASGTPYPTRPAPRLLLALREAPGYPAALADLLGVGRQNLSNHLS
jgi:hypothetical protein